jgi:outer membrane lipoprotein SlyB
MQGYMPRMLGQAMIQRDQLELLLAAVAGAGLGGITGIVLGHEELGTLIWALVGAVVVSGVVYFYWSLRRH